MGTSPDLWTRSGWSGMPNRACSVSGRGSPQIAPIAGRAEPGSWLVSSYTDLRIKVQRSYRSDIVHSVPAGPDIQRTGIRISPCEGIECRFSQRHHLPLLPLRPGEGHRGRDREPQKLLLLQPVHLPHRATRIPLSTRGRPKPPTGGTLCLTSFATDVETI